MVTTHAPALFVDQRLPIVVKLCLLLLHLCVQGLLLLSELLLKVLHALLGLGRLREGSIVGAGNLHTPRTCSSSIATLALSLGWSVFKEQWLPYFTMLGSACSSIPSMSCAV